MSSWGTAIFSDDMAQDIRREYNILLSTGKESNDIEEILISYYSSILNCNNPDEDVFWFALAHCEWKKGRLSTTVKEKALFALENGHDLDRWNSPGNKKNYEKRKKVLSELRNLILSPMPSVKRIKKPITHHCPWKVGSLLAYRIVSNKQSLYNHPCFMKYVLLRVIKIDKHPLSILCDTEYYNETMLVGLYNWIGSKIPDPKIVNELRYIPIKDSSLFGSFDCANSPLLVNISGASKNTREHIASTFERKAVKCVQLDWISNSNAEGDISYLDCDDTYQNSIPDFFDSSSASCLLTHFLPFDITLSKRFEPYLDRDIDFDYILI